jgi:hypothetical protein
MHKGLILLIVVWSLLGNLHAQKGEKSIAAGLFVAFPDKQSTYVDFTRWKTSIGVEAIGQYAFSNKSALLFQLQAVRLSGDHFNGSVEHPTHELSTALKGGYRLQLYPSGFFINALVGLELNRGNTTGTLGLGNRFELPDNRYLDIGVEYTEGYLKTYRLRAVFSLLRRTGDN